MPIKDGWFYETSELWPGQAFGIKVNKVLYEGKTMFQEVLVFESATYGNVLVLDGVVQATERDEFAYQEMISHVPLMSHPNPKRVLVVGGGDGGCVREVLKHKGVERVDLVEIDQTVIDLSLKYLPSMASCLDKTNGDKRVTVHICDGFKYLAENMGTYDVIISDTSDPEGPAVQLFEKPYFNLLRDSLTEDGLVAMQASENCWLKLDVLNKLQTACNEVFASAKYSATCVPTYTSGQLGLIFCSKSDKVDVRKPSRTDPTLDNRYYTPETHEASFVLPTFARRYLKE